MCQSSDCTIIHEPLVTVISNLYFMLENLHCIRFYNDAKAIVNDHILVSARISFGCFVVWNIRLHSLVFYNSRAVLVQTSDTVY